MIPKLTSAYKKLTFPTWSVPLALLALCALSFGLLAPRLGFYWDDWPPQLVSRVYGISSFWKYYSTDRPFSAWTYVLFTPILGSSPLRWHLFSLLLRWLTGVGLWWTLLSIFPTCKRQAAFASALFVVYPVFTQQALAVTYHQAWVEYALYFVSLGAMVNAVRKPQRWLPYTLLSTAAFLLNLSISEYFIGIELSRPFILWFALRGEPAARKRLWQVFKNWLPYLAILAAYVIWRLFLVNIPGDPNTPNLLYNLFKGSLEARQRLQTVFLQDTVFILFSNWYKALDPAMFINIQPFTWLAWGAGLAGGLAAAFYFLRLAPNGLEGLQEGQEPNNMQESAAHWLRMALVVGLPAALLGPLPAWLIDRQAFSGFNADRYALAAMFGASLVWTALVEWAAQARVRKTVLLCVLLGLAISLQLRTANDYRWEWNSQTRFYWQLAWRAPAVQPGTAMFSEDDPFPEQSLFATSAALNLVYPQAHDPALLNTWLFTIRPRYNDDVMRLVNGKDISTRFRIFAFDGRVPDTLVLYYNPTQSACLWVLNPEDQADPDLPEYSRRASVISNLARISDAPAAGFPPAGVFGKEPAHSWWCYTYQKADLARQKGDWQAVADLSDQARQNGYSPDNAASSSPHEWTPAVLGYAQIGRWDDAAALTRSIAAKRTGRYQAMMCSLWQHIAQSAPPSAQKDDTVKALTTELKCKVGGL